MRQFNLFLIMIFVVGTGGRARQYHDGPPVCSSNEPVDFVKPMIGTQEKLGRGRTFPAVGVPFAATPWTPTNHTGDWPYMHDGATIPRIDDPMVMKGFRATHWPNGGFMREYGAFEVMPVIGDLKVLPEQRGSEFRHATETATPYYYAVTLDDYNVRAELTAQKHTGFLRFTYPETQDRYLVIDARRGGAYVEVLPEENLIVGWSTENEETSEGGTKGYFAATFNKPFEQYGTWKKKETNPRSKTAKGQHPGAFIRFSALDGEVIKMKMAVSLISIDKAKSLLENEITHWNFDRVRSDVRDTWNEMLSQVQVTGGTKAQKTQFYTALYNLYRHPRSGTENGEHWSPFDGNVYETDSEFYVIDETFWDTSRAKHPLLSILKPQVETDTIRSLVHAYEKSGWLPAAAQPGDRQVMIGSHADVVIANAFVRGLRDYDVEKAFEGMLKNAREEEEGRGRKGIQYYNKYGYVPADKMGTYRGRIGDQSTSRTLEFAYDDFAIAQVAKGLGKQALYEAFKQRSMNWKKVFDPDVGFVRGRNADGSWTNEPFDPLKRHGPFTEATAWHYTWSVRQDAGGLIEAMGGRQPFIERLNTALAEGEKTSYLAIPPRPEHQNLYFWFGNEPVHHAMYMFNWAGAPWKTQKWVRTIQQKSFSDGPEGLPGDEDTGQMSAWYLFSGMGFYPTSPATPNYEIGSPLFEKITVRLDEKYYDGNTFTVVADGTSEQNRYIQSATLNGEPLRRAYITHDEITSGGTLKLEMGPTPNKDLWSSPEAAPPSVSDSR